MNCISCNVELKPVNETYTRRRSDFPQYENALVIDFRGGFGMYFDNLADILDNGPLRAVVCGDCANNLEAEVPWIHELLNPDKPKLRALLTGPSIFDRCEYSHLTLGQCILSSDHKPDVAHQWENNG